MPTPSSPSYYRRSWPVVTISAILLLALIPLALSLRADWRATGVPNDASEEWFVSDQDHPFFAELDRLQQQSTASEIQTWTRILAVSPDFQQYIRDSLDISDLSDIPAPILNEPWSAEPVVASVLESYAGVLDLAKSQSELDHAIWLPAPILYDRGTIDFFVTNHEDASQLAWLLRLNAEAAIHRGEPKEAIVSLQAISATASAIDWRTPRSLIYHNHILNTRDQAIGRSLQSRAWTGEELETLQTMVEAPLNLAERWRAVFGYLQRELQYRMSARPGINSSRDSSMVRAYEELQQMVSDSPEQLLSQFDTWSLNQRDFFDSFDQNSEPIVIAVANSVRSRVAQHQLTLTAIGLKRFQLDQGRWPANLNELAEVGLNRDDWTLPGVGELDYQIQGDEVTLSMPQDAMDFGYAPNVVTIR